MVCRTCYENHILARQSELSCARVRTTGPAARAGVAQAAMAAQPRGGALQQQGVLDEQHVAQAHETRLVHAWGNTKGYSSTRLAMGFANVRAGTWYAAQTEIRKGCVLEAGSRANTRKQRDGMPLAK